MKNKEQIVNECLTKLIAACALEKMKRIVAQNEDKWITIHPHGKDGGDGESNDYRRLLIKDGETVEDAMHRQGYYDKRKAKDEKKEKENKAQKDNIKEEKHTTPKKISFVAATNKTDAFNETNNYITDITSPIISISLDNINKINEGLHFIYNNVCKFAKIKDITKSRMSALAAADSKHLVIGSMFNYNEAKSKEEFDKEVTNWQKDNQKIIDLLKNKSALSRKEKNILRNAKKI